MAQRSSISSAGFIAIIFAVAIAVIFGVSLELPDTARTMACLLAWLTLVAVVFRALELAFDATIGKRKAN